MTWRGAKEVFVKGLLDSHFVSVYFEVTKSMKFGDSPLRRDRQFLKFTRIIEWKRFIMFTVRVLCAICIVSLHQNTSIFQLFIDIFEILGIYYVWIGVSYRD